MRICEIFSSIQGEGILMGLPTVFIRTVGCNLRCHWCDTSYAWEGGKDMELDDIVELIEEYPQKNICITGGEPLLQKDLIELLDLLRDRNISIETNGSLDISQFVERDLMVSMDYKTPSSGMDDRMLDENLVKLRDSDQLKFVIADDDDIEFAYEVMMNSDIIADVIFQPAWGTDMERLVAWVLDKNVDVRIMPQLHKIIWGDKRGF